MFPAEMEGELTISKIASSTDSVNGLILICVQSLELGTNFAVKCFNPPK